MTSTTRSNADLVHDYFRAKAEAYASPMAIGAGLRAAAKDFVVVDVRNPAPGLNTRITGSVWIPERDMARRFAELPKDKLIVLYCWDTWCGLATSAALVLMAHGYRVKELHGGTKAWKTLGLPETEIDERQVGAAA